VLRALLAFALMLSAMMARGQILRVYWIGIGGTAVSDLTGAASFPDHPSGSNLLTSLEAPINWADTYGTRLRGYITAPSTGPYVFWIASDDNSELWLSTSDDPETKSLIASVPGWTNSREWAKYPSQQSASINLTAGQQYYVEALQKEGSGGDNVAVGWDKPGESTAAPSEIIPGTVLTPWTGPKPGYNSRPVATVPPAQWLSEAPVSIQLTATVKDDGNPLPADPANPDPNDPNKLRWNWSVASLPAASSGVVWSGHATSGEAFTYAGSANSPGTIFTCDPTATFDVPGLYLLQFNGSDGEKQTTNQLNVFIKSTGLYRQLGYSFLSPLPGAEYSSPQTRFVLVRFEDIPPSAVTNLSQFIQVTGARSGVHAGRTKIAGDNRTVIFQMSSDFQPNELVTVALTPAVGPGAGGTPQPYQYQFMISTHMLDPATITARGDNPPSESRYKAFDANPNNQWRDLIVPDGSANFSWIQYVYPGSETHVVNKYAITSASDAPERDPRDWNVYGVDTADNLTLLDTQTGQTFANRLQRNIYSISNAAAFRGYRLEITSVNNPNIADSVQVAELEFIPGSGTILRQYWLGIPGTAVTDLTANPNYPNNPSGTDQLTSFEAPTDWADYYGTRLRGYITAPNTGAYVFWIASDDNSELWLSTDSNPVNKARIAYVADWTSSREWNKYPSQKSAAINLTLGQKYYVEALQKEGQGGDNVAVGWAKPGQATSVPSEVIPGEVLTPWTGGNVASAKVIRNQLRPSNQPLSITRPAVERASRPLAERPALEGANASETRAPLLAAPTAAISNGGHTRRRLSAIMPNGVSVPSDFPLINITTAGPNPDPDYIFLDNRGGGGHPYNVIFDNAGSPIWYMREPDERRDMKVQHNGVLTLLARTGGYRFVGLNTNYQEIASYWGVNGYGVDEHELQVLADGSYLLVALRSETVDMSRYVAGGNPAASVTEQVIQQFTAAGDLIFQWRAWDHFDIRDQQSFIDLTGSGFDFPHMNSLDVDTDGHILLSSRSTSECTKINHDTGEIVWRLGGPHGDLAFVNDPLQGTRNQHALRSVGTNHYTIFDNGDQHSPSESRAVEYQIDPTNHTATLVWQYPATPTPSIYSFYMGNAQRLTNGNTLINWAVGNLPKLTEVRPDGTKAFEMNWVDQWESYRVWRCPWHGVALQPYLILEPYPDNLTLIFNQFGDTNIAYYRIYAGPSPHPTTVLATSGTTLKSLSNLTNGLYYFRVTAVNKAGVEGAFSNEENVNVNIIKPGQNMVANGDFSQGTNSWTWTLSGTAVAAWRIESGASHFDITNGGTTLADIQLLQAGKALVQGKKYVFEFDAWSDQTRYIDVKVAQNIPPFTDYSRIPSPFLNPNRTHYRYLFTMQQPSDFSANLIFNLGASAADVYLDNISLFNPPVGDLNLDGHVDFLDLGIYGGNWLKQQSGLPGDLDGNNKVDFTDFGILGENWSGGH